MRKMQAERQAMKITSTPATSVSRAQQYYERELRSHLEPGNRGKFIVIDVDNKTYSIGDEYLPLIDAALEKTPQRNWSS